MTKIPLTDREQRTIDAVQLWLTSWGEVTEMIAAQVGGGSTRKTNAPPWVQECAARLTNTIFHPALRALASPVYNGYNAGYAIGIMRWGATRLDEKPPKELVALSRQIRFSPRAKKILGRLIEDFFCKHGHMKRREFGQSKFIPAEAHRLHTRAGDLPAHEASEYYRGLSEGLRGVGRNIPGDRSNDATDIYLLMGMWWRRIDRLESITELHTLLVRLLGAPRVGDKKRVEKICERIGLTLRAPGRPPEIPTPAHPA